MVCFAFGKILTLTLEAHNMLYVAYQAYAQLFQ